MRFKILLAFILFNINIYSFKTVLVTGASGYIGSATALYLTKKNYKVVILDKNKLKSDYLSKLKDVDFIQGDFSDEKILDQIFNKYNIEAVIHFAGFIEVGASVKNPFIYYENNLIKSIILLKKMISYKVDKFIFSSSAAVYGIPKEIPIKENLIKLPISPYGKTKYMLELVLKDFAKAYNIQAVALRYFNAAGALPKYNIGERHENETHLIPLVLNSVYNNLEFNIFGDSYNTKDGTCIRDYIHIKDLSRAHFLALKYLNNNKNIKFKAFNLGTGIGYSVKEIIFQVEKATEKKVKFKVSEKRDGDPDILICDIEKAKKILNFNPKYSSIENIVSDANRFYKDNN